MIFNFLEMGQPLGTVTIPVEVVASQVVEERQTPRGRAVRTAGTVQAPERVLLVLWDPKHKILRTNLIQNGGAYWQECQPISLPEGPQAWASQLLGDLTKLGERFDPVTGQTTLETTEIDKRVKILGRNIWSRLPSDFRALYGEQRHRWQDQSLMILSQEPYVPWELVWPYGIDWEDEEPWCLGMQLSRWLMQGADGRGNAEPPVWLPLESIACVVPSDSGLPSAALERKLLQDIVEKRGLEDLSPRPTWPAPGPAVGTLARQSHLVPL